MLKIVRMPSLILTLPTMALRHFVLGLLSALKRYNQAIFYKIQSMGWRTLWQGKVLALLVLR